MWQCGCLYNSPACAQGKGGCQALSVSLPAPQLAALLPYHPGKFCCQVFMQSRKASLSDAESNSSVDVKK